MNETGKNSMAHWLGLRGQRDTRRSAIVEVVVGVLGMVGGVVVIGNWYGILIGSFVGSLAATVALGLTRSRSQRA